MSLQSPVREQYQVLLREFDWANAPQGSDPHYWVVADIRLGGRSLIDDFARLSSMPQYFTWETWGGFIRWSRTREQALVVAEQMIKQHREHYFVSADLEYPLA